MKNAGMILAGVIALMGGAIAAIFWWGIPNPDKEKMIKVREAKAEKKRSSELESELNDENKIDHGTNEVN